MSDDPGEKMGLAAALAAIGAGNLADQVAEQLPLLPVGDLSEGEDGEQLPAKRRPGRPSGAKNRSTSDMVEYLSNRYRSPLIALAEAYSRPVAVLAKEIGCSKLEAFKLQVLAAKELAPYMHQKQPVAIQVDNSGHVSLVIERGDGVAIGIDGGGAGIGVDEGVRVIEGEIIEGDGERIGDGLSDDEEGNENA